ncbi:MAG TPA: recombinase family protein [Actinomycetes bacterium]|jgi:DNA invertase Pin-like site-specific DNA recombinase|nr:recombinase family protein [Actinomycetes bacterium]
MSRQVGLARVSTIDQDPGMQRAALERAGCTTIIERELSSLSEEWRRDRDAVLVGLKPGDTLIVWKFDRLGRNLLDLVTTIDALLTRGVKVRSLTEGLDLDTPMGRFGFQVLAAAAEFERNLIIERTTASLRTKIEAGQVVKGYRLYGFAEDGITHVPDEVVIIQEVTRRILAGESVHAVVDDLNARGIPSTTGGAWRRYGLRELLRNPRLAGLHSYKGKVLGPGDWEPIISKEEREALLARLPRFRGRGVGGGTPVRYAYSGLLTCAVCKTGKITGNSRGASKPYYGCGNPKCHKTSIKAELLERDLNIAVLSKLLDPAFVERIVRAAGGDPTLNTRLAEDRQLLVRLARQFGEGKFIEEEWLAMREPIERRIRQAEDQQANQPNQALLAALQTFRKYEHLTIDELEALEDQTGKEIDTPLNHWLSWPAEQRRQVLRLIIDLGVLKPATGARTTRGTRELRVSVRFK